MVFFLKNKIVIEGYWCGYLSFSFLLLLLLLLYIFFLILLIKNIHFQLSLSFISKNIFFFFLVNHNV